MNSFFVAVITSSFDNVMRLSRQVGFALDPKPQTEVCTGTEGKV